MRVPLTLVSILLFSPGCSCGGDAPLPLGESGSTSEDTEAECGIGGDVTLFDGGARLEVFGCGGIVLETVRVVGEGSFSYNLYSDGREIIVEIIAGQDGGTLRAVHGEGRWWGMGDQSPVLWRQGYASQSPSGVFALPADTLAFDADGLPLTGGDSGGVVASEAVPDTSWWVGLVGRADGVSVAMGATQSQVSAFYTAFEDDRFHWIWGGRGEARFVDPGDSVFLDPVWVAVSDDPSLLLETYAAAVATQLEVTVSGGPPSGWSLERVQSVTEADLPEHLSRLAAVSGVDTRGAVEGVQLGDGWQAQRGQWVAGDAFPSGMSAAAGEIEDAGFVAGIWLAPFHVDRDTDLYRDNLDWFLRSQGDELDSLGYAILDGSHPDARAWMADQVASLVNQGFTVVELDHLAAGAVPADRFSSMSGIEAYQRTLEEIRQAVPEGTWIVAAGAPLLPTVGYVEAWRSGPSWAEEQGSLMAQARSSSARSFMNGLWWWNTPDRLSVGDALGMNDVSGAVVTQAVSGGAWILGDDLEGLAEERIDGVMRAELMSLSGQQVSPVNPLGFLSEFDAALDPGGGAGVQQAPHTWVFSSGHTALLNLGEGDIEIEAPGGVELISGVQAAPGVRTLAPGAGEIWR